ncbi:transcriptional regulator [Bacillus pseudomycoides]|uniref:Transcriptional regulator n=1 Tax=Bacillus pseudomycoides TaxID=64104 RepID=A0AA91V9Z9_9BACI|nr:MULTISPECIES: helix-turn-helix transcriptional regulator [Bacillus]PEB55260.1 transcriptional regulator [Bacillus sp. AFS098217]PED81186.1 transcriptional regulator [Bacillus pseudomycoides]PFW65247.1 transcriptional regulator [Bacillus sp. AFS075034]
MDIGKKIKHLRLINKMTQEDVANQLFISRQVISKWELGKSLPDLTNLLALSNLFNVSIDSLLKEDSNLQNQIIKQSNYKRYLLIASLYIYSLITIVVICCCFIAFLLIPKDIRTSDLEVINSHFYKEADNKEILYIYSKLKPFFSSYSGDYGFKIKEHEIEIHANRNSFPFKNKDVLFSIKKDIAHGIDWEEKDVYIVDENNKKILIYNHKNKQLYYQLKN